MTPYTKKIVELHKIHKAIEEKDCCNGGGNTPSGDITIDDVVKFIHYNMEAADPDMFPYKFPYTTWDEIPEYNDVNEGEVYKVTDGSHPLITILNTPSYIIAVKAGFGPVS